MNELNSILFSPLKYEERFYWDFKEVLLEGNSNQKEDFKMKESDFSNQLESMIADGFSTSIFNNEDGYTNPNYPKLINLIVKRFLHKLCFYTDSNNFDLNKSHNFIAKICMIIEMTSPRYLALLGAYTSSEGKLLDPVKITNSGTIRFNDTPQDEGDFANDSHTTNITEDNRETFNDLDSKMGRIREIESNYNNVLLNWSNEFEAIFMEEENI